MNRKAALIAAANYRVDIRTFRVYDGMYAVRFYLKPGDHPYEADRQCGPLFLDELDPDKTFEQVLIDLLGEEPPVRGERDARWRDARAKMLDLTVRETRI